MESKLKHFLSFSSVLLLVSIISFATSFFSMAILEGEVFEGFLLFLLVSNLFSSVSSFCIQNAVLRRGLSIIAEYRLVCSYLLLNFLLGVAGGVYFYLTNNNYYILACSFFYSVFHSVCLIMSAHHQGSKNLFPFTIYSMFPNVFRLFMLFYFVAVNSSSYILFSGLFFLSTLISAADVFISLRKNKRYSSSVSVISDSSAIIKSLHWQVLSTFVIMAFTVFPQIISVNLLTSQDVKIVSFVFLVIGGLVLFPNIIFGRLYFKSLNEREFNFSFFDVRFGILLGVFFVFLVLVTIFLSNFYSYLLKNVTINGLVFLLLPLMVFTKILLVPLQVSCMRESLVRFKFIYEATVLLILVGLVVVFGAEFGVNGVLVSVLVADVLLLSFLLRKIYAK